MTDTIDLNNQPLTVQMVVSILSRLTTDGEVHVSNCARNPQDVHRIMTCMNSRLSEGDKAWIRATIAEELEMAK
jgi:hypothetical protein